MCIMLIVRERERSESDFFLEDKRLDEWVSFEQVVRKSKKKKSSQVERRGVNVMGFFNSL